MGLGDERVQPLVFFEDEEDVVIPAVLADQSGQFRRRRIGEGNLHLLVLILAHDQLVPLADNARAHVEAIIGYEVFAQPAHLDAEAAPPGQHPELAVALPGRIQLDQRLLAVLRRRFTAIRQLHEAHADLELAGGPVAASLAFGALLANFAQIRLIQVIQGAAVATMVLNIVALWKQEARDPSRTRGGAGKPSFAESWRAFRQSGSSMLRACAVKPSARAIFAAAGPISRRRSMPTATTLVTLMKSCTQSGEAYRAAPSVGITWLGPAV